MSSNQVTNGSGVTELVKAISKLLAKLFKSGDGQKGLMSLNTLVDGLHEHLGKDSDKNNALTQWANDNAKEFTDKVKRFALENNEQLGDLASKGKLSEMNQMILEGVAKDIHLGMENGEMPVEVATDPNRRNDDYVAKSMERFKDFSDITDNTDLEDCLSLISKDTESKLSSPALSQNEQDNKITYDKTNDKEREFSSPSVDYRGSSNELSI